MSETFLLFGDPAMKLKLPLPTRVSGLVAQGGVSGVSLSWQGATDCNGNPVDGYNIYRGTSPGGPYAKLNVALIGGTQYYDTAGPTTYYYVVTAVDSDGDESVYSEERSAAVGGGSQSEDSSGGGGGACFVNTVTGR